MAKAFKQHIAMWVTLVLMCGLAIAGAVWLKSREAKPDTSAVPADSTQPADTQRSDPPSISLARVADGFSAPVDIAASGQSGDERLYIVEQGGTIRILEDGGIRQTALLDLSERVIFSGEQGLLGLVFDPDFESNRYFYVNYTEPSQTGRRTVISRFTASEDGHTADSSSEKRILTASQPYANHNGGDLNFGPDGYLYIGLGDGGSSGDPQDRAQNGNSILGKMLRIDVDSEQAYDVPDDNPFAGREGFNPALWSLGLRNPWRFSFDSATGAMWIADVGQNAFEEINFEPADTPGRNYGWRCYEADTEYNLEGCGESSEYTFPAASYEHQSGPPCGGSVSGGYVYRGQDFPQLDGFYFYADYCSGRIYSLDAERDEPEQHVVLETELRITTFGTDNQQELYLADVGEGVIYKIVGQR